MRDEAAVDGRKKEQDTRRALIRGFLEREVVTKDEFGPLIEAVKIKRGLAGETTTIEPGDILAKRLDSFLMAHEIPLEEVPDLFKAEIIRREHHSNVGAIASRQQRLCFP